MTDLTEQWKKDKLVDDECYYIRTDMGSCFAVTGESIACENYIDGCEIVEVLAKVPSYEEWRDLEDDLATCDKDLNNVCEQKEELYEENEKLKELLHKALDYVYKDFLKNVRVGYTPKSAILIKEIKEILKDYGEKEILYCREIDEVLK